LRAVAFDGDSWLQYASAGNFESIEAADVILYPQSHEVFIARKNVPCGQAHFHLLTILLSAFCKTVPYERMMPDREPRPLTPNELNLLKVQVCRLRRLLREHGARIDIRNVYGRGYQARPSS
jgi:DNA-binding response OmpR family regulator